MQNKSKNPVINAVEKAELCKGRMLRTFTSAFEETGDSKKAYEKAKGVIRKFASEKILVNYRQILGLYGELTYFYKSFQDQQLTV